MLRLEFNQGEDVDPYDPLIRLTPVTFATEPAQWALKRAERRKACQRLADVWPQIVLNALETLRVDGTYQAIASGCQAIAEDPSVLDTAGSYLPRWATLRAGADGHLWVVIDLAEASREHLTPSKLRELVDEGQEAARAFDRRVRGAADKGGS